MYDVTGWKHVFKLDPDKIISDNELDRLCESGTDAIIIGGSDNVTEENVLNLMSRIRHFLVPCVLEVSTIESVVPGFDLYFIPTVLNSRHPKWIVGLHKEAMKEFGEIMSTDEMVVEGYCIMNPDCKAATLTEANTDLDLEDVKAFARVADSLLKLPIFYVEYSGTFGNPEWVKEIKKTLQNATTLFYGGGISNSSQAKEMSEHADVIVVGNAVYENFEEALKTVEAVKNGR
jgi:putative glycerol-1-phosphate prenyltransferase